MISWLIKPNYIHPRRPFVPGMLISLMVSFSNTLRGSAIPWWTWALHVELMFR